MPGVYEVQDTMMGVMLSHTRTVSDKTLDLPSEEFKAILGRFQTFLTPEAKKKYEDMGAIYKSSMLLYGAPGTGKSVLLSRIAKQAVLDADAIVLRGDDARQMWRAIRMINDRQPDALIVVIFDEFDKVVDEDEEMLLRMLDSGEQRDNMVFLAATNYLESIPERVRRVGRFPIVLEIGAPNHTAREYFFREIYPAGSLTEDKVTALAEYTKGLYVDDLKEVAHLNYIYKVPIVEAVLQLRRHKKTLPTVVDMSPKAIENRIEHLMPVLLNSKKDLERQGKRISGDDTTGDDMGRSQYLGKSLKKTIKDSEEEMELLEKLKPLSPAERFILLKETGKLEEFIGNEDNYYKTSTTTEPVDQRRFEGF